MIEDYERITLPDEDFLYQKRDQRTLKIRLLQGKPIYPKEGGILTFYDGMKYPIKGFAEDEIVKEVAILKRAMISLIRFLVKSPMKYLLLLLPIIPKNILKRIFWTAIEEFVNFSRLVLYRHILKPDRFCQSGREIFRVLNEMTENHVPIEKKELLTEFNLDFLMIWEFDTFYRYCGQDILGEAKKEAMLKNPKQEISKLFKIFLERTQIKKIKENWHSLEIAIKILLLNKHIKNLIKEFFQKVDLEKIKLDKADLYFAYPKKGYRFQGKSYEEGMRERENL